MAPLGTDVHFCISAKVVNIYSQHRLIQPLVIKPTHLIRPIPLDTLHWLPMLKATLNLTPRQIRLKILS